MSDFYRMADDTPFLRACDRALEEINANAGELDEADWAMIARMQHARGEDHSEAVRNAGQYGCAMCDEPHLYDEDWNFLGLD